MATNLYLRSAVPDTHLGTDNANLIGTNVGWSSRSLSTTAPTGFTALSPGNNTVAGTTLGVEVAETLGGTRVEWISPPVAADVTIAGTITANIWAVESNMSANAAINVVIEVIRANATATRNSNTLVQIVKSARVIEMGTTVAAENFTMTPTSTVVNRGDRIRVRVFGDDVGTMATGFSFSINYDASAAGFGESYVSFTETITFESAPAGSVIYLTDTASAVSTASVDREAWTSRGAGVQTDVTNTTAGWTAPIHMTDTAGGTVVDWFTKPLQAVTLGGMAVANLRALESNALANASPRCQIARVDNDGTNATVWADWCIAPTGTDNGELTTSEVARTANVSGDDLSISDNQRLRIRIYVDETSNAAGGASQTMTFYYAGTSAAASGDSYITMPVTLTEKTSGTTYTKAGYAVESA